MVLARESQSIVGYRSMSLCRRSLSGLAAAVILVAGAPHAAAQQDVIKIAERLNKKAMDDFDNMEFDSAKQTLQGAIAKLRDAGLDETPTAARIYVNLG